MYSNGHLVVIGSNPPTTNGIRTLRRVEAARDILGFTTVSVANLFSLATYRTTEIAIMGAKREGWIQARPHIQEELTRANAVLLAYGIKHPTGDAREHFREQIEWLNLRITEAGLPVWWVGNGPRHPSRWHRYTHHVDPARNFIDVLAEALNRRSDP